MSFIVQSMLVLGPGLLGWDAPAQCPSAEVVSRRVDELRLSEGSVEAVAATGKIRRTPWSEFHLELEISTPTGTSRYELDGPECAALGSAAALLIATALDAGASQREAAPAEDATRPDESMGMKSRAEPAPTPRASTGDDAPANRRGARRRPLTTLLQVGYFGGLGRERPFSHGPSIGVGLTRRRLRLEGIVRYAVPQGHAWQAGRTVVSSSALGALRGCGRYGNDTAEVLLCGVVEAGGVWARGRGWDENYRTLRPSLGAGASTGLRLRLGERLGIMADAEALVAIAYPRLVADGTTVWAASPVGGRFSVGMEWRVGR